MSSRTLHSPSAVPAPLPCRQTSGKVASRQVGFRPVQQLRKARAIVIDQCEEHGVSLPFAGGPIARRVIDDAALGVEKVLRVRLPQRPGLLRVRCRQLRQKKKQGDPRARQTKARESLCGLL